MNTPKYIKTKEGLFTFIAWYEFSINGVPGSEWIGAQANDKDGNSFGVHINSITERIYEVDTSNRHTLGKKG